MLFSKLQCQFDISGGCSKHQIISINKVRDLSSCFSKSGCNLWLHFCKDDRVPSILSEASNTAENSSFSSSLLSLHQGVFLEHQSNATFLLLMIQPVISIKMSLIVMSSLENKLILYPLSLFISFVAPLHLKISYQ